jgi:fructan beta-fructosidase
MHKKEWRTNKKMKKKIIFVGVFVWGAVVMMSALAAISAEPVVSNDPKQQIEAAQRQLQIEHRYLHLPVRNGAPKQRMKFVVDDHTVRDFEIELADETPDFWVFSDVSPFLRQTLTIHMDSLPANSQGLASIAQADVIPGAEELYQEKYRPQFHFTSRRGWNNDPNGLVYFDGEYHLYYQHNPYGWNWGNMHWGHAVSPDLVHWNELPIALYPRQFGDWCFSGGAVVDWENTAGFKSGDEDVIVASYTSTGRGECIAYSNDRGRTFTDYEGNPVVKHRGRDPKIIWYAPGKHWVMAVYDELEDSRGIAFYTSVDLKNWARQSRIVEYYECPEIFELPVDGNETNKKWVVYAADGEYAIGSFDGKTFTKESGKHRFNYGNCFYASQTYSDIPPEDGRRIQIAWGRIGHRDMPFNQMMNFPVELTLRTTDEGIRMFAQPVKEIEILHRKDHVRENVILQPGENPLAGIKGDLFDIRVEWEIADAVECGLFVRGIPITYDVGKQELTCLDKIAPLKVEKRKITLQVLVDRMSIEIFANDGGIYMPIGVIPDDGDHSLGIFSKGGITKVNSLKVYELNSAWKY